jgi:FixJ family two-component response regulator
MEVHTSLDGISIVFVVEDDVSVRESLELLIQNAGWRPELFASAQDFLLTPGPPSPAAWYSM